MILSMPMDYLDINAIAFTVQQSLLDCDNHREDDLYNFGDIQSYSC